MEDKKTKILERLRISRQISTKDNEEQNEIIKQQEEEISKYKALSIFNLNKLNLQM